MQQPNIVMIMIDDLGARDLSCYGSSFYETPNLDRLAAEGLQFNNAYASCPVCSPTRASLMTGKYPARVGITQYIGGHNEGRLQDVPYLHYLPLEETSIATALANGGYQSWHVGKWHLGDEDFYPEKHGFDVNIGGCHWGMPKGPNGYFSPYGMENLSDGPEGEYLTDRLTDEAIDLIKNRGDRPFFLNLSHYAVHTPIMAPEHLVEKYRRKAAELGLDTQQAIVEGEYFSILSISDLRIQRRVIQSDPAYAAMIENLDDNIGRLLAALDEEGLSENTLVVFTSDNGGLATSEGSPTCNAPLAEGKGWNREGGTRVCQMMRWPGVIPAGSSSTENVQTCDFYPTFLEAAGLGLLPEQHCDGVSLLSHLRNTTPLDRQDIFWHYPHYSNQGGCPAATVLRGPWKLTHYFEDNSFELFNLDDDIAEEHNLIDQHPEIAAQLRESLDVWKREVEAKIPQENEGWQQKLKRPEIANNAHV